MRMIVYFALALSLGGTFGSKLGFGQGLARPRFEVASVKPTSLDPAQARQAMASGVTIRVGKHVYEGRVEYIGMGLGELICDAYDLRPVQVVGLDPSYTAHFDVIAKLPANSRKEDLNLMLQDLLADRFRAF